MTARELLGSDHPLTRATRRFETACVHLLCGLAMLAGIAVFASGPVRPPELAAGIAGCVILGALAAIRWDSRRRRALEVIIAGHEDLPLNELEPVRRRLHDGRRRSQLASSLEGYLQRAEKWDRTLPRFRPVGNARLLMLYADTIREIARLLRADAVPRARGVALCEWLLTDGVTSPLFRNDSDALRRELGRIRFDLEATSQR
jgi:hypothetical protein